MSRSALVHVARRPLRYPRGWPAVRAQEKGVDVALALDYVRLAVEGAYDVGIPMSTDTELVPPREGRPVIHQRLSLGGNRPRCHHLRREDYLAVHDPRDYARGGPWTELLAAPFVSPFASRTAPAATNAARYPLSSRAGRPAPAHRAGRGDRVTPSGATPRPRTLTPSKELPACASCAARSPSRQSRSR